MSNHDSREEFSFICYISGQRKTIRVPHNRIQTNGYKGAALSTILKRGSPCKDCKLRPLADLYTEISNGNNGGGYEVWRCGEKHLGEIYKKRAQDAKPSS